MVFKTVYLVDSGGYRPLSYSILFNAEITASDRDYIEKFPSVVYVTSASKQNCSAVKPPVIQRGVASLVHERSSHERDL